MTKFDPHAEYTDLSARLRDKATSLNRSVRERKAAALLREAAKGIDDLLSGLSIGKDEMARIAKDGERFRWLRDALVTTDAEFFIAVDSECHEGRWALPANEVDAAIDAAMIRHNNLPLMDVTITPTVVYAT